MILTITLNASIDKAYTLSGALAPGEVMRVKKTSNSAGGKGLNVARIIKLLDRDALATGFVGGFNGSYLESLLNSDQITHKFYHIAGETRSCINVLDTKYFSTEFLEAGPSVSKAEQDGFLKLYEGLLGQADVVSISGSLPHGVSPTFYKTLICKAKEQSRQVIVDTSGEALSQALYAKPTLIKPNDDEIRALLQKDELTQVDLIAFCQKMCEGGIAFCMVSLGARGALLGCKDAVYMGTPPQIEVKNTVGAGDAMVAGFAAALESGLGPQELLRMGIASGSAAAAHPKTGVLEPDVYTKILPAITLEQIA